MQMRYTLYSFQTQAALFKIWVLVLKMQNPGFVPADKNLSCAAKMKKCDSTVANSLSYLLTTQNK